MSVFTSRIAVVLLTRKKKIALGFKLKYGLKKKLNLTITVDTQKNWKILRFFFFF